jgi:hypothetical protein
MNMSNPTLSVIINHRDRSFYDDGQVLVPLFRKSYDCLIEALDKSGIDAEIVIADWLTDYSARYGIGPWCDDPRVNVVRCFGDFTRGGGRMLGANSARGEVFFFMDADMIVPAHLIKRGIEIARDRKGFFPLYKRQDKFDRSKLNDGIGTGNAFCLGEMFRDSCGFPEKKTWGGEDTAFWMWFVRRNLSVREPVEGFIHQWHPGEGPDKGLPRVRPV